MMWYIDANVFVYAALDTSNKGEWSGELIRAIEMGRLKACTSFLTWDEFFYVLEKTIDRASAIQYSDAFWRIPNLSFIPVDMDVMEKTREIITITNLQPRDAIHVASSLISGVRGIISEDSDLTKLPFLDCAWLINIDDLIEPDQLVE